MSKLANSIQQELRQKLSLCPTGIYLSSRETEDIINKLFCIRRPDSPTFLRKGEGDVIAKAYPEERSLPCRRRENLVAALRSQLNDNRDRLNANLLNLLDRRQFQRRSTLS